MLVERPFSPVHLCELEKWKVCSGCPLCGEQNRRGDNVIEAGKARQVRGYEFAIMITFQKFLPTKGGLLTSIQTERRVTYKEGLLRAKPLSERGRESNRVESDRQLSPAIACMHARTSYLPSGSYPRSPRPRRSKSGEMSDDHRGSSVQGALAAEPGSAPSSSAGSTSSATPAPEVAPVASSSSTSPPLHAQAVRFLTSLRQHSPNSSVEAQRGFLKAKGLDEAAIDAAFQDAARPSSLALPSTSTSTSSSSSGSGSTASGAETLSEEAAFDQASRAFDDPIHVPGPVVPAKNYPRSPLALYYEEAQGRVDEAARRQETTRRYQVLLGFFRSLSWMLTFGGGLAALGVLAYRVSVRGETRDKIESSICGIRSQCNSRADRS